MVLWSIIFPVDVVKSRLAVSGASTPLLSMLASIQRVGVISIFLPSVSSQGHSRKCVLSRHTNLIHQDDLIQAPYAPGKVLQKPEGRGFIIIVVVIGVIVIIIFIITMRVSFRLKALEPCTLVWLQPCSGQLLPLELCFSSLKTPEWP